MEPDICDISKCQIKRDNETAEVSSDKVAIECEREREHLLTSLEKLHPRVSHGKHAILCLLITYKNIFIALIIIF